MKKINIKFIAIALILIYVITANTVVFASASRTDEINPAEYAPGRPNLSESQEIVTITSKALGVLRNAGIVLSVVTVAIIGLKFMFSSLEERAKYKEMMLPWVFGIFLICFSGVMVSYIYDMATAKPPTTAQQSSYYAPYVHTLEQLENYLNNGYYISYIPDEVINELYEEYKNNPNSAALLSPENATKLIKRWRAIQNAGEHIPEFD